MELLVQKEIGRLITKAISKDSLSYNEANRAFTVILNNEVNEMQQGAFLAALAAKGETLEEITACWQAIYDIDTIKAEWNDNCELVDNCGTGRDTFKTFNISTAASLLAASGGIKMARHGARSITSLCGTVDMAEALGVDVECSVATVVNSIRKANIGLFNGMNSTVHPFALGRILSQINFGSTLNIAASLAHPALPKIAVRGVYSKTLVKPVTTIMKQIGYKKALVIYGAIDHSDKGMDEASVCGTTYCAELKLDGSISEFSFRPEDFNITCRDCREIACYYHIDEEVSEFLKVIMGIGNAARKEAVILNSALIFYLSDKVQSIQEGIDLSRLLLKEEQAFEALKLWVTYQNSNADVGLKKLAKLIAMSKNRESL